MATDLLPPPADTALAIAGHAARIALEERIGELLRWRAWYRRQADWGHWMDLAVKNDIRLRELVAVARQARRISRPAIDRVAHRQAELARGDHFRYPQDLA